jgi:hypothetical protein
MKALKEKRVTNKMTLYILYQRVDETRFEKITGATFVKGSMENTVHILQSSSSHKTD